MKTRMLIVLFFVFSIVAMADVWVYNYPDTIVSDTVNGENIRSNMYDVKVLQNGISNTCYVMRDKNQATLTFNPDPDFQPDLIPDNTNYNHWTNFSRTGDVTIRITRLDGKPISWCNVYPSKKGFFADISGNIATIRIPQANKPLQLFVDFNDAEEDPLFLFCDPAETNIPNPKAKNVLVIKKGMSASEVIDAITNTTKPIIYFEPGVHTYKVYEKHLANADGSRAQNCILTEGYNLPLLSNKTYYIPGGCYLQGGFSGKNVSNTTIKGRGIISACGLTSIRSTKGLPYTLLNFDGAGKSQCVDGIVVADPPHFSIVSRGEITVNNVKMFGWWISSDGVVGGDDSRFTNNFFKVNDDNIKLYSNRNICDNNTIYHQVNGAPFQFCWATQNGNNNLATNTYIVKSNNFETSDNKIGNTAVINLVKLSAAKTYKNNRWDGLYIDNGCHRLLGIDGCNLGTFDSWSFNNVEINSKSKQMSQFLNSYLVNGTFSNFNFTNFTINGFPINRVSSIGNSNGTFWCAGETQGIVIDSNK